MPVHPIRFLDPGPPFGGDAGFVHFVPELRPPRVGERPQREVRCRELRLDAHGPVQRRIRVVPALLVPVSQRHVVLSGGVVGVLPGARFQLGQLGGQLDTLGGEGGDGGEDREQ